MILIFLDKHFSPWCLFDRPCWRAEVRVMWLCRSRHRIWSIVEVGQMTCPLDRSSDPPNITMHARPGDAQRAMPLTDKPQHLATVNLPIEVTRHIMWSCWKRDFSKWYFSFRYLIRIRSLSWLSSAIRRSEASVLSTRLSSNDDISLDQSGGMQGIRMHESASHVLLPNFV